MHRQSNRIERSPAEVTFQHKARQGSLRYPVRAVELECCRLGCVSHYPISLVGCGRRERFPFEVSDRACPEIQSVLLENLL